MSASSDLYLDFLRREAKSRGIKVPSDKTLRRYGLNERSWLMIFHRQGWKCPICLTTSSLWNTDHHHARGWSRMPAKKRVTYVRGIICWLCNRYQAPSTISSEHAHRLAEYIEAYEQRRRKGE